MFLKLIGNWKEGVAFDYHTLWSFPKTFDENGKVSKWDTKWTLMGQALYELKYCNNRAIALTIAECIYEDFLLLVNKEYKFDVIIPVPPSNKNRIYQPVYEIMKHLSNLTTIPVDFKSLVKVKETKQLKGIENSEERIELLKDSFSIDIKAVEGKNVLLFDDLYRSGETLKAITNILYTMGKVQNVYVLTLTKTRSKK